MTDWFLSHTQHTPPHSTPKVVDTDLSLQCVPVLQERYGVLHKKKQNHGSWEDVYGHFSSNQWKGEEIDGRVSPRTGVSDRIVLVHCVGHESRLRLVWESLFLLVLLKMTLGGGRIL